MGTSTGIGIVIAIEIAVEASRPVGTSEHKTRTLNTLKTAEGPESRASKTRASDLRSQVMKVPGLDLSSRY
jgi:hypothetical protein